MHTASLIILALTLTVTAFPILAQAPPSGSLRSWENYQVFMWTSDSAYKKPEKLPLFFQRLKEMGITAGMVHSGADPRPLLSNNIPYYVENMVNRGLCLKWNSKVTDWDKFVTEWARNGRSESALVRDYCLDDPKWQAYAKDEIQRIARVNAANEPLAYDIRDELSVTISANPFDYDFHPLALAGYRQWLKTQYANLAALNDHWQTQFSSWDEVRPFTTDQIKHRMGSGKPIPEGKPDWADVAHLKFQLSEARKNPTRWNFAPWATFRTYMDISLARSLDQLRAHARQVDPRTPVGIEGTQMPHAFGGYDLWRLSQALDWVEPYDIGNAREIFGSFMPDKVLMATVFENQTDQARRRLWHLLLEGDQGCIIWWSEDCIDWESQDYQLTRKAKALAPVLKELTSPLARLFLRARKLHDPIYIHYSQPSIQVDWLIESTVDGPTWLRRFSSFESDHNLQAKTRNAWLKIFQDQGFSPQFVSTTQIEAGALERAHKPVLVLPTSWALTDKEAAAIRSLSERAVAGGAALLFDGTPGVFDGHGRLRPAGVLDHFFSPSATNGVTLFAGTTNPVAYPISHYATARVNLNVLPPPLPDLRPEVAIPPAARVRVHRYQSPKATLLAFERNISWHMSEELKQKGGNEPLERPIVFEATLNSPLHIYELWSGKYLGLASRIRCELDPWRPLLYALLPAPAPAGDLVQNLSSP